MMDATALKMAIAPESLTPDDVQLLSSGVVTLGVLNKRKVHNWNTEDAVLRIVRGKPDTTRAFVDPVLTDDEWKLGWDALCEMGVARASNEKSVRATFLALRELYAADAVALARKFNAIRSPWSGTRAFAEPVVFPETPLSLDGKVAQ
jgi:hypothetical protein